MLLRMIVHHSAQGKNECVRMRKTDAYTDLSEEHIPSATIKILDIIVLSFIDTKFRRLDYVSVFKWNLLSWVQSTELVPVFVVWAKIIRYDLKTETQSSLRNFVY
jgi:hypothetical protein